jgi:hypothetical protein
MPGGAYVFSEDRPIARAYPERAQWIHRQTRDYVSIPGCWAHAHQLGELDRSTGERPALLLVMRRPMRFNSGTMVRLERAAF